MFTVIGPTDGRAPKGQGDVTLVNIYCRMTDLRERKFSQRDAMADARAILADYPDIRAAVQDVNLFSSSAFKNAAARREPPRAGRRRSSRSTRPRS